MDLSVDVYRLTRQFPADELYGLTSQLRRAAVSVASNLVEGYGRASRPEFRRFVAVARGSLLEVETQLMLACRLGLVSEARVKKTQDTAEEIAKMLWALMEKLSRNQRLIPEG